MNTTISTRSPQFTNREEYLAYRTAWRSEYKEISQKIRDTKRAIVEAYRTGDSDEASSLQSRLHYTRLRANELMVARTKATELMRAQRAAALESIAA